MRPVERLTRHPQYKRDSSPFKKFFEFAHLLGAPRFGARVVAGVVRVVRAWCARGVRVVRAWCARGARGARGAGKKEKGRRRRRREEKKEKDRARGARGQEPHPHVWQALKRYCARAAHRVSSRCALSRPGEPPMTPASPAKSSPAKGIEIPPAPAGFPAGAWVAFYTKTLAKIEKTALKRADANYKRNFDRTARQQQAAAEKKSRESAKLAEYLTKFKGGREETLQIAEDFLLPEIIAQFSEFLQNPKIQKQLEGLQIILNCSKTQDSAGPNIVIRNNPTRRVLHKVALERILENKMAAMAAEDSDLPADELPSDAWEEENSSDKK